jgi:hypothetical protein
MIEDPNVTVCWEDSEGIDHRATMKESEARSRIDNSKNIAFCAKCKHDINKHAAVKNWRMQAAGRCHIKSCKCRRYEPGQIKTKKELDLERAKIKAKSSYSK